MRIFTGLLLAAFLLALFPASVEAWGDSVNSHANLWNVKKPYNSWWGRCNSCSSCSGGTCGLNDTTSTDSSSYDVNHTSGSTINKQVDCSSSKYSPAYSVSIGVIDCTSSNASSKPVIDCTGSVPFYSTQRTYVYYQNTVTCPPGGTCQQ